MKKIILGIALLLTTAPLWGQAATLVDASIPLPGGATAVYTTGGLKYYRRGDSLGSHRLASTTSQVPQFDTAYAAFGEDYSDASGSCPTCLGTPDFTFSAMPQNDATAGGTSATWGDLFNPPVRTYSAQQGRFISPDPEASLFDPQSFNPYSYANNSPFISSDPSGAQDDPGDPGDPGNGCDSDACGIIFSGGDYNYDTFGQLWYGGSNVLGINWSSVSFSNFAWSSFWKGITNAGLPVNYKVIGQPVSYDPIEHWVTQKIDSHPDYQPICSSCRINWGTAKVGYTLTSAFSAGVAGGMGASLTEIPSIIARTEVATEATSTARLLWLEDLGQANVPSRNLTWEAEAWLDKPAKYGTMEAVNGSHWIRESITLIREDGPLAKPASKVLRIWLTGKKNAGAAALEGADEALWAHFESKGGNYVRENAELHAMTPIDKKYGTVRWSTYGKYPHGWEPEPEPPQWHYKGSE